MSEPREWTPYELFHTYMRGWRDGATVSAIRKEMANHALGVAQFVAWAHSKQPPTGEQAWDAACEDQP